MVTKEQAINEVNFHYGECSEKIGSRGGKTVSQTRARANGQCQTWKRDSERFRLPVKHGLYSYGEITDLNADQFHTASDCPISE